MDSLSNEQIRFEDMCYKEDSEHFKVSVISCRLKKLITKKMETEEWRVMQIPIDQNTINFPGYNCAFVAPSKKSILLTKEKDFMFSFQRKRSRWQQTF